MNVVAATWVGHESGRPRVFVWFSACACCCFESSVEDERELGFCVLVMKVRVLGWLYVDSRV